MATVAETPPTLDEANDLLNATDPPFTAPTQPWPAGAYVPIGGGVSGKPLSEAHWNGTAFVVGRVDNDPAGLDLTKSVLGNQNEGSIKGNISDSLNELKISPTHGDGRLSAVTAELFVEGSFVQLADGKAHYDSGQSGTPPAAGSTGVWVTGTSPADAPGVVTGVTAGTPGSWLPSGATPPVSLVYANALATNPGFAINPRTAWTTGQHVILGDDLVSDVHWDGSAFVDGPAL